MKKFIMIALALILCLALASCRPADDKQGSVGTPEPEKATAAPTEAPTEEPTEEPAKEKTFELARMVTTTVTTGSDPQTVVQGMEYDGRGLVTFIITGDGETVTREPVSYTFNENGDPVGFAMKLEGSEIIASVENRYEAGELTEALIKDVTVNGFPLAENDDGSAFIAVRNALTQPLRNYVGYENCTLRVDMDEIEIRYEEGRIVYSLAVYPNLIQEVITEYLPDGSVRTKQNELMNRGEDRTLASGSGTLTDADGFCLEQTMTYPATGEELILRFRYEDSADPDTGAARKLAYFDEIVIPDSMTAEAEEGDMAALEQIKTMPILIFTLDGEGRIAKQEQSQEYMLLMGGGSMLSDTSWFENGRIVKHETVFGTMTTTAEYDYR